MFSQAKLIGCHETRPHNLSSVCPSKIGLHLVCKLYMALEEVIDGCAELNSTETNLSLQRLLLLNTRPQRVFSSVQTCGLVDVNQPLRCFSRVGQEKIREDSFPVSRALVGTCRRINRFCNIWLQDLTPLHVKMARSTNLLQVIDLFTHRNLQPHKLSQYTLATCLCSC